MKLCKANPALDQKRLAMLTYKEIVKARRRDDDLPIFEAIQRPVWLDLRPA